MPLFAIPQEQTARSVSEPVLNLGAGARSSCGAVMANLDVESATASLVTTCPAVVEAIGA
jgi:hypothetical protein